jgi:type 1 fimbria pilin
MVSVLKDNHVGIVIKTDKANAMTLNSSTHSNNLVKNSTDIYYILLPGSKMTGPYYASELILK